MGHAFEAILADTLCRWHKINGRETHYLTGSDEHGYKVENTARDKGITPKELCDHYSSVFRQLNKDLQCEFSRFIRTTDPDHRQTGYDVMDMCKDDIYLGVYHGWYNPREETFVTEHDAKMTDYCDPVSGKQYTKIHEPSYFFRLAKYQNRIKTYIETHPDFIVPDTYRNQIIQRLETPLTDLSISRVSIEWGIPVPDDPEHVLYVWFDALINYLTGANGMWPADIQVIGKDIVWFHTVIWMGILMSAKLDMPRHLFVHGFVCDETGQKMSKSIGNVISPTDLLQEYPVSAIRYYLVSQFTNGGDFSFSKEALERVHDSYLLNNLGNYVNRVFSLLHKYSNSIVPGSKATPLFNVAETVKRMDDCIGKFKLNSYAEEAMNILTQLNTYVNDTHIWTVGKLDDPRTEGDRQQIVRTLLEGMYIATHLIHPIVPDKSLQILSFLDMPLLQNIVDLNWNNLIDGVTIEKQPTLLFTILDQKAAARRKNKHTK
jgi:methionyl-tRNA synthetase